MKPEHTKEFNAEHAKAGAPYCQKSDLPARIGIWDSKDRNGYVLNGSVESGDGSERHMQWTEKGICSTGFASSDLVMLPLGMCEGKPVFAGDELVNGGGRAFTVEAKTQIFPSHRWPKTAPVMPSFNWIYEALDNREKLELYWKALDEYEGGLK